MVDVGSLLLNTPDRLLATHGHPVKCFKNRACSGFSMGRFIFDNIFGCIFVFSVNDEEVFVCFHGICAYHTTKCKQTLTGLLKKLGS